ncbi:hypothetical protein H6P81_017476 [Aristolochia fimbriata]|uniref:KIB1-4 beta-propeller domain-containing protein n=1 Tax=Aristolochia fimbriata TaxID=158543 RepID=A0AAV7DYF0_ARIFI|nr:hypothetical protein H6P81_017476 [Aristolochia fimbriata]
MDLDQQRNCIGSFHGWLVMKNPSSASTLSRTLLLNPLSRQQLWLPSFSRLSYLAFEPRKVVLSSSPSSPDGEIMAAALGGFYHLTNLAFAWLGDKKWTVIPPEDRDDKKEKLYGVTVEGDRLLQFGATRERQSSTFSSEATRQSDRQTAASSRALLEERRSRFTCAHVSGLDDRALFLGENACISQSSVSGVCTSDCTYFSSHYLDYRDSLMGIVNFKEETLMPLTEDELTWSSCVPVWSEPRFW